MQKGEIFSICTDFATENICQKTVIFEFCQRMKEEMWLLFQKF